MIRSAILTGSISRNAGGLFDGVRCLVQSLVAGGIEERVYGVQDEFTEADSVAWQPAVATAFNPSWPRRFGYSPRFLEELLAFNPDLTHTHGIWNYPSMATTTFSRKRRSPYIISPHGMLDPWAVRNSRWKKKIAYMLYEGEHLRGARCLRALCEQEARSIRQLGLRNEIAIIPNGVVAPKGPAPTCRPWNGTIEPGKRVLLFLGRIHPKKGLANLLRAWAQVPRSCSSAWVLAIAGWEEGGHEQELKHLATTLGLSWADEPREKATDAGGSPNHQTTQNGRKLDLEDAASVVFLGPQFNEAKAACYYFSDAFILPSVSEGLPMAVLEAWAYSKPVLMTPQCNLPEGFDTGAALKVETNWEDIARGLNELFRLTEPERADMGKRAAALATKRFTWPAIGDQMKGVYEWMLGGGLKPGCLANF